MPKEINPVELWDAITSWCLGRKSLVEVAFVLDCNAEVVVKLFQDNRLCTDGGRRLEGVNPAMVTFVILYAMQQKTREGLAAFTAKK